MLAILPTVLDFVREKQIQLGKLVSVCTDGASSMMGKQGIPCCFVRTETSHLKLSLYYAPGTLCAHWCGVELCDVMASVVGIVNWILT